MFKKTLTLGVAPLKRASRDMNFAKGQKDQIMAIIRQIRPEIVKIVDIDDLSENGIAFKNVGRTGGGKEVSGSGYRRPVHPFLRFWGGVGRGGNRRRVSSAHAGLGLAG